MADLDRRATLPGIFTVRRHIVGVALGSDADRAIWQNSHGARVAVVACRVIPDAAHSGAATNFMELGLVNKLKLGVGTVVVAPQKQYLSGVDLIAFKPDTLPVSTTAADVIIDEGEVLAFSKTEGGTGLASPDLVVEVDLEFIGPTLS